jgi:type IV secretory pathway TraG/TraD family ATPase VirD4
MGAAFGVEGRIRGPAEVIMASGRNLEGKGQPTGGVDLLLGVTAAGVTLGALLWAAGAVSAWMTGHRVNRGRPLAGYAAFAHFGAPGRAWGAPVGAPVVYWMVTLVFLAVAGMAVWGVWRLWRYDPATRQEEDPRFTDGMATGRRVTRAAGPKALLARSSGLRASLRKPGPADVGYQLGVSQGRACWASVEDSMLVLGPPRAGKGLHEVIPMILDSPGAVVTTSTRPDNLAITVRARAERGPVMIFDPEGLAGHPPGLPALRWSLTRGCEISRTSMIRAETLVGDAKHSGVENANFWRTQAVSATQCLLHAAALDGRPAADLYRWSHTAGGAKEAVTILGSHPKATPGWDRALDAIIAIDQRTRDSIWAMVANSFSPLADPAVLAAVTPKTAEEFDPLAFLAMRGTIYLLGTAGHESLATASLVAALLEDLIDAARRLAARSPRQRLDPPLALVLDEAANYPLPSLPSLMSEGGGSGITTVAVLQSLAQARGTWGRDRAQALWDSAIVKIILGGSSNAEDLADLSRLIGERQVREWSETRHGGPGGRSVSSTVRYRPILEPAHLRVLPFGTGLLLLRSVPPIMMTLTPWTSRPDAADLQQAQQSWEEQALRA